MQNSRPLNEISRVLVPACWTAKNWLGRLTVMASGPCFSLMPKPRLGLMVCWAVMRMVFA